MANSVYFDPALGGDGSTVTDDNNPTTGLGNNGHRYRFVPALSQTVVMAGTAKNSAQTATTKATEAAASAAAALASEDAAELSATAALQMLNGALRYSFNAYSNTSDPATSKINFGGASAAATTEIRTSYTDLALISNALYLQSFDDSTSTNKGILLLRNPSAAKYAAFQVTAVVDNTTYCTITVTHIESTGAFVANDVMILEFDRAGDKGDSGGATAGSVSFTPAGNISATNVQTAIEELDSEKARLTGGNTFTGTQIVAGVTDTVHAATGTSYALTNADGLIVTWALTANSTITDSLTTGQSVLLQVTPSTFTLTFPTVAWTKAGGGGAAPTLYSSGKTNVLFWKVGSTLYGTHLGDA